MIGCYGGVCIKVRFFIRSLALRGSDLLYRFCVILKTGSILCSPALRRGRICVKNAVVLSLAERGRDTSRECSLAIKTSRPRRAGARKNNMQVYNGKIV